MDRTQVAQWLDRYIEAWRAADRGSVAALFTEDAAYRYHPYDEPVVGAAAIADDWLANPDVPGSWEAEYRPVAVDGDDAVAVGTSRYRPTADTPARLYHNVFVMGFASDGRCREFTEFFMLVPA